MGFRERRRNFEIGLDDPERHLVLSRRYTIADIAAKNARIRADAAAIVAADGTETTYAQLDDRSNRLANALRDRGYDYGMRAAIVAENRAEYPEILFGAAKLGGLVASVNWRLAREELLHCLSVADPDVLFLSDEHAHNREWIKASSELSPTIVSLDGASWGTPYESLRNGGDSTRPATVNDVRPEDGLSVLYTSGTSGLPKGVVISHRAFVARALLRIGTLGLDEDAPDYIAWTPMFHVAGTDPLFAVCLLGGTYHVLERFNPEQIVNRLRQSRTKWLNLMPSTVERMLEYADQHGLREESFPSLSHIGVMPDLVDPDKIRSVTELFDAEYFNTFGLTETGLAPASGNTLPVGAHPTESEFSKLETPLCEVKLVDEDWEEVQLGEIGELTMRGPTLCSGYLGDPEATRDAFRDGWFRCGDLFVRNEDGTLNYVDRRRYLIKSGGENVYPGEIERAILEHPDVSEAVVIRVPDERWGEVPKLYLTPATDATLDSEAVLNHLNGRIANYKHPHYIEFTGSDRFPRSTTGKIVREEVEGWEVSADERVRDP